MGPNSVVYAVRFKLMHQKLSLPTLCTYHLFYCFVSCVHLSYLCVLHDSFNEDHRVSVFDKMFRKFIFSATTFDRLKTFVKAQTERSTVCPVEL